jgi:hypothetical protein
MARRSLPLVLAIALAGCTAPGLPVPSGTPSGTALTRGTAAPALGAVFDATPAYPGLPWTRDGRPVTPEELGTIGGPAHCGWEPSTFLFIGWPPGTRSTSSAEIRQYIRDPRGVVRPRFREGFGASVSLPADARPTGYRSGGVEVYLSPRDQDEAIYLVGPGGTERWPRSDPLTLCE